MSSHFATFSLVLCVTICGTLPAVADETGAGADGRQGELIAIAQSNFSSTVEHDHLVDAIVALGYTTVDVDSVIDAFKAGAHALVVYASGYDSGGLGGSRFATWCPRLR